MAETEQTRITRFGGNPTTYNNNSARILKGRDVMVLRPEGGVEHRMYDDGTMTRVDDRTGESIPVPAAYDAYWRDAFEQAQTNARPNLLQRGVHWVGRGIEKAGNWLQRFENGGTAQQPESNKQKRMKELLLIINGAAKELSTKQPGDNVAYLAQVIQDPQEAALIDAIIAEIPDAQEVIDQVSLLSSQMFKCGGKTKKKVKKGAKGCVPCKKLMKVGGRLINVLTDCEGNIISKHQAGGWLIPKGEEGLETKYKVSSAYRTNKTGTGTVGQLHYYIGANGNLYSQQVNENGLWDTGTLVTSGFDDKNFNDWSNSLGADASFWATGFNKDTNTFDTEANARAAMGDVYDTGTITGQTVHGVTATGNKYIGDTPDKLKVTADLYVLHHGSWQNAMQAEDDILKAKRRASRVLARERRQNMRDQFRVGNTASIDFNGDGQIDTNTETFTSRQAARQKIRSNKQNYMKGAREARANNQMKILGTISNPISATGTTPTSTEVTTNDKLALGGWLNKYKDGGETEPKLSEYKFHRGEIKTPAGYSVIQEGFYPTYSFGNKTGITYDFDDSPRWGRNIYITPHGNDTVYYHTSDPYEYLDMYPTYILVGTPYKSQQVAKKGWHNMLHGANIPVRPLDGDEAAFNRAKKEK